MRSILRSGDRVSYRTEGGRRCRGTVQDVLPCGQDKIPVLKRGRVHWIERGQVRKLPVVGKQISFSD